MKMKYKVWHIERKEWIHDPWDLYIDPDGDVWEIEERGSYDRYMSKTCMTDKVKIVLFTGLKDKNGVEIYEGDLLEHESEDNGVWKTYEACAVVYNEDDAAFCFENDEGNALTVHRNFVVVGNIYENADLLPPGHQSTE